MDEPIVFDPVDSLAVGAVGEPGSRRFLIQADKGAARLTVLVEKEQMALLALESVAFLDRIEAERPGGGPDPTGRAAGAPAVPLEPAEPMFRARRIGLGFEPERNLVVIELQERGSADEEERSEGPPGGGAPRPGAGAGVPDGLDPESAVARLYATPAQVRAMAATAVEAVARGRPRCPLCDQPMDPQGHRCPRWN